MFSKWLENTVGKGEIALYEQFLLFPVFSKDVYYRHIKTQACLRKGKRLNMMSAKAFKIDHFFSFLFH